MTGVSWFEACAFCQWRCSDSDWTIRLPTETEWEAVATPDRRTYPLGQAEPDPELANFAGNVGSPSPVGVYLSGDGAFGHCDLAGNVWEWIDDVWDQAKKNAKEKAGSSSVCVARGGFWNGIPSNLELNPGTGTPPTSGTTMSDSALPASLLNYSRGICAGTWIADLTGMKRS